MLARLQDGLVCCSVCKQATHSAPQAVAMAAHACKAVVQQRSPWAHQPFDNQEISLQVDDGNLGLQ